MSGAPTEVDVEVAVVGAGIAGLAAARELASAGRTPLVIDAGSRPGGVMQTDTVDGYRVETGPNTFQAKAPFCGFASRHHLWSQLQESRPESRDRWILRGDQLVPLPHGLASALTTPLVSAGAKLRILAEPFVKKGDASGESVHDFVSRRLGAEVSSELVGAFLTGVYAGDERRLGIEAVFPPLVAWERSHGSLVRGAIAGAFARSKDAGAEGEEPARRGTWSGREGLGSLADALAASLPEPPRLNTRVRELERDADAWRLSLDGPSGQELVRARQVVLATPAFATAELLAGLDPDCAKALGGIQYAPIVAVGLGVDPAEVRGEIEGFGFIVPRSADTKLLGCLFMSRLFPGRAPAGRELLHCMIGGVRWPEAVDLPDDVLLAQLHADLDRSLGLDEKPRTVSVRRWPRAIPQPDGDHVRRIGAIEQQISSQPGLVLAGSFLAGVSVADTLASGVRAAHVLAEG